MGQVLSTVAFHFGGLLVTAHLPEEAAPEEDSDGFVGLIRYAEGSVVAAFLRRREEGVKVSLRSRGGVSAQNIALRLGGGGHVPAAGATLKDVDLDRAYELLLEAVAEELRRAGYL
jgi:phosphoesterase RecJ-like protein